MCVVFESPAFYCINLKDSAHLKIQEDSVCPKATMNAVNEIRQAKRRPGSAEIKAVVTRKTGLSKLEVQRHLDFLLKSAAIITNQERMEKSRCLYLTWNQ